MTKINCRIKSKPHAHLQTMEKDKVTKWQKLMQGLYIKTTCTFSDHGENMCKVSKRLYKIVWGVALTTVYTLRLKNDTSSQSGKSGKNNLTIISKPHAYPHTMKKTCAKFQQDYKTRGVALTRQEGKCWRMDKQTETCMPKAPMLKQVWQ